MMFKRISLFCLVFCGLVFSQMPGECFADASTYFGQATSHYEAGEYQKARELYQYAVDTRPKDLDYAIWSQTLVVLSNIDAGNMEGAGAAIEKLITDFAGNEHIAEVVHHIAFHCLTSKRYEKARELYQYILDNWPNDENCAIWSQTGVGMSSISLGDTEAADAAGAKLLNKFSDNRHIAEEVHHLAWHCRYMAGDHTRALQYYQYVVDHWPGNEKYAIWSQGGIALSYIDLGNSAAAQTAIDKLFAEFSGNERLAEAVDKIAYHYRELKEYEKATQYYQYILDHWPGSKYAMWSQTGLALLHIDLGNSAVAEATIDKLISDFFGNEGLVDEVHHIAYHYRVLKKYEKAKQHYQYILDHWPDKNPYAIWSQSGLILSFIALGQIEDAEDNTDKLLTDFRDNEYIAATVYDIAYSYNQLGEYEKARQFYQYILLNWPQAEHGIRTQIGLAQSIIGLGDNNDAEAVVNHLIANLTTDFPIDTSLPAEVAEAFYYAGDCYNKLGDYAKSIESYQRVVNDCPSYHLAWNALFMVGRNYQSLKESNITTELEADTMTRMAYEQVLEQYPDCKAVKIAKYWLSHHNSK